MKGCGSVRFGSVGFGGRRKGTGGEGTGGEGKVEWSGVERCLGSSRRGVEWVGEGRDVVGIEKAVLYQEGGWKGLG